MTSVYRIVIQTDGSLGASGHAGVWNAEQSLPVPRARLGFGVFNGYLYAAGGDSGTVTPNDSAVATTSAISDVALAGIDLNTREVQPWTTSTTHLADVRTAATLVVGGAPGGGNVLVTGGLYTNAPTGEETYDSLSAVNGDLASSFTAAGNTIASLCGGCVIFNHGATGYWDKSDQFHVLVVGGDNQLNPSKMRPETYSY